LIVLNNCIVLMRIWDVYHVCDKELMTLETFFLFSEW